MDDVVRKCPFCNNKKKVILNGLFSKKEKWRHFLCSDNILTNSDYIQNTFLAKQHLGQFNRWDLRFNRPGIC